MASLNRSRRYGLSAPSQDDQLSDNKSKSSLLNKHEKYCDCKECVIRKARAVKEAVLPPLRYRRLPVCLLICYLPFLIIPWVLTCVIAVRPLNFPTYYDQMGRLGSIQVLAILWWYGFIRVLNSIASLITVPIISALLAQGAVVYCQRRRVKQTLNLRQTFALADKGWNDITTLWAALKGSGKSSKYLWLATGLLFLSKCFSLISDIANGCWGIVNQPLSSLLLLR